MAWYSQAASAPPILPPRPLSTYPSAQYDDRQAYNRQPERPMYNSPAPADYNFQFNSFPQPLVPSTPQSPPPPSQSLPSSYAWNANVNVGRPPPERRQSTVSTPPNITPTRLNSARTDVDHVDTSAKLYSICVTSKLPADLSFISTA